MIVGISCRISQDDCLCSIPHGSKTGGTVSLEHVKRNVGIRKVTATCIYTIVCWVGGGSLKCGHYRLFTLSPVPWYKRQRAMLYVPFLPFGFLAIPEELSA